MEVVKRGVRNWTATQIRELPFFRSYRFGVSHLEHPRVVAGRLRTLEGCCCSDHIVLCTRASNDLQTNGHAVCAEAGTNRGRRVADQIDWIGVIHPRYQIAIIKMLGNVLADVERASPSVSSEAFLFPRRDFTRLFRWRTRTAVLPCCILFTERADWSNPAKRPNAATGRR
jgi:hypothetical protein